MARRKRVSLGGSSVSLLDLLCSSTGAVVLLLILSNSGAMNRLTRVRRDLKQTEAAVKQTSELIGDIESLSMKVRDWSKEFPARPPTPDADAGALLTLSPQTAAKNLVILLDTSGSMARYYPDTPRHAAVPAKLKAAGPKWAQTVALVEWILCTSPALERFAVLRLTDDQDGRSGHPIGMQAGSRWLPVEGTGRRAVALAIQETTTALRAITPEGGSNHHAAFEHLFEYLGSRGSDPAADTIIVITDGLPNHGPGDSSALHPLRGTMVSVASKNGRMQVVQELMRSRFSAMTPAALGKVKLHVICMPWPDDSELPAFAMSLASHTRGNVLFVPPPRAR